MKITYKYLKDCTSRDFTQLHNLDADTCKEFGEIFSEEIWNVDNFKYILPSKMDISLTVWSDNVLCGYCIGSLKKESYYIHRFVVKHPLLEKKLPYLLLTEFFKKATKDIYLQVNTLNFSAISFYERNGFEKCGKKYLDYLPQESLQSIAFEKKSDVNIKYLMVRKYE